MGFLAYIVLLLEILILLLKLYLLSFLKNLASKTHSPEHIVFLYEEGRLFHMKLVEMGFAELTQ